MKVLLDVSNLGLAFGSGVTRTGIFRATEGLVRALMHRPDIEVRFAAFESFAAEVQLARYDRGAGGILAKRTVRAWDGSGTSLDSGMALVDELEGEGQGTSAGKRIAAELALVNRLARPLPVAPAVDVYHSLRYPLESRARVDARARAVTIHDMVPILFPELAEHRFVVQHQAIMDSVDPAEDWLICNSRSTKDDACTIMGLAPERAFVTPFAADPELFRPEPDASKIASVLKQRGLEGRSYLLGLNTIEPRKNLSVLLRAFFALVDRGEAPDASLVLVGPVGWKSGDFFQNLGARPDLEDRVVLTGYLPDEELSAVYSGASAFVYPSLYEGFGLPPLEAMQCGVPVITSSTSSLPEVVGSAAVTVDPSDEEALAAAMRRVLNDRDLAADLSRRGLERSRGFSWARTAERTVSAYRAMLEAS